MKRILQARTTVSRLWLIALLLWLSVTAAAVAILWHLHRNVLDGQSREIRLLSLALADEMDRGMQGVENGLNAIRVQLRAGKIPSTVGEAEVTLNALARFMPLVRSLWLIGPDGRPLAASDKTPVPDLLSFWPLLDKIGNDTPAVSRTFIDIDKHEALVAVAVRFESTPVTPVGWVIASIPAQGLLGALSTDSPVTDAHLAVFRDDGARLAGSLGNAPPRDELTTAAILADRPAIYLHKFRDGSERLVSQHALPRYGLKMVLTRDIDTVLATWRDTAEISATGLALLLAILAGSVALVVGADRRHAKAEQALQTQRTRVSKLESLGALAGGVAHDFNNILAAILGFGEMAQDAAAPASAQARHLDKVLQAALRGKSLAERILTFSRGGAHRLVVFELAPVVDEVLNLLATSPNANVVIERRLEAIASRVRGDPTQAFEALMNLCTNAIQAMNDTGGTLRVELTRVRIDKLRVLSHSQLTSGNYLKICVSDQGTGITPDVMEHLFEPFFSMRGSKSGTGLGLAIVHGVVVEFGGAIDVQSMPGHGSLFSLFFPECTQALSVADPSTRTAPEGTGQRLMVVDDDPMLVALEVELLAGLGYEPEGYGDPLAALAALRENHARFRAVITDEAMPGLCGTQLTRALRSFAPDLPVLLLTGFGGASLTDRAIAAGVTRVLSKPLQRADLARALNELLH